MTRLRCTCLFSRGDCGCGAGSAINESRDRPRILFGEHELSEVSMEQMVA